MRYLSHGDIYHGDFDSFVMWDSPSVCCEYVLLPLVNKEATFSQWLNRVNSGLKEIERESRRGK